jgi:hypothetical protein
MASLDEAFFDGSSCIISGKKIRQITVDIKYLLSSVLYRMSNHDIVFPAIY